MATVRPSKGRQCTRARDEEDGPFDGGDASQDSDFDEDKSTCEALRRKRKEKRGRNAQQKEKEAQERVPRLHNVLYERQMGDAYFKTPLITGDDMDLSAIADELLQPESPEELARRQHRRAVTKSMVIPSILGVPSLILLVGVNLVRASVPPMECELPLLDLLWWSQLIWIHSILVSCVCFADGYRTTSKDPEQLPFGPCCLPLILGVSCALLGYAVSTGVGLSRYVHAANTREPVFACRGNYMNASWWVLWVQFCGLSAIFCAVSAVLWF